MWFKSGPFRPFVFVCCAALPALCLSATSAQADTKPPAKMAGPAIPSNLVIGGRITSSGAGSPPVLPGSVVNALNVADNAVVGSGAIADVTGAYSVSMSKPTSFNGTQMTLQIIVKGTAYQLLEQGKPVRLPYAGTGKLFPVIIAKSLTVGAEYGKPQPAAPTVATAPAPAPAPATAAAAAAPAAPSAAAAPAAEKDKDSATVPASVRNGICPAELPRCDVNGDGVFDQKDIDFIKEALKQHPPDPRADVNGDGVVNTRDLIDAMRALANWQRAHPPVTMGAK